VLDDDGDGGTLLLYGSQEEDISPLLFTHTHRSG
jgi:hypothetical protein